MKRTLLMFAAFLLSIVGVTILAAVYVYVSVGDSVGDMVEQMGSAIVGVPVTVDDADLSYATGYGVLRGLRVDNADGFDASFALTCDEVRFTIDVDTMSSEALIVEDVLIVAPTVVFEPVPDGSNIDDLRRNVTAFGAQYASRAGEDGAAPKLIIRSVRTRDGRLRVTSTAGPNGWRTVSLPDLYVADIAGADGRGATPTEVVDAIIADLLDRIARTRAVR